MAKDEEASTEIVIFRKDGGTSRDIVTQSELRDYIKEHIADDASKSYGYISTTKGLVSVFSDEGVEGRVSVTDSGLLTIVREGELFRAYSPSGWDSYTPPE